MQTRFCNNFILIVSIFVYRILLDLCYLIIITRYYEYLNYKNEFSTVNYIISWSVLLLLLPFIVSFFKWKNSERLFANIMSLIFLIRFIPGTSLMAVYAYAFKYVDVLRFVLVVNLFCFLYCKTNTCI